MNAIPTSHCNLGVQLKSEELIEYELSSNGRLLLVKSREFHAMHLFANKGLGNRVESYIEMQQIPSTSNRNGNGGGKKVAQRTHQSLDEAVDSLMDWYRVFELAADVDGEIHDLKQDNTTVRMEIYCNFLQ